MEKRKEIFPGYVMIVAGAIVSYWGAGIYVYSIGNYVKIFIDNFGWTRAQVSLASSFNGIASGLQGAGVGIAIDKFGPRVTSLVGFTMLGLGFYLLHYVDSLWMFYVFWLIAGLGYSMGSLPSLDAALANWFVKRRGFMLSLMHLGLCFAGPTVTPFVMWLLLRFGIQNAFVYLGIATLCIALPLTWFFVKPRRPEYYGWLPDGRRVDENLNGDTEAAIQAGVEYAAAGEEIEFTVRQALRDKTVWILSISSALSMMSFNALSVHTIPFLTDMGIDPIVAATAMGTMVLARLPTQLLFGWLGDRVPKVQLKYLVMLAYAITAAGLYIFTQATSMAWIWAYVIVYGLGNGATMGIQMPLRGRYWGRKAFASIGGIIMPFGMVAGIIAPVYAGWVYDSTGSYQTAFNLILILSIIGTVSLWFLSPPKPPVEVSRVTDFL